MKKYLVSIILCLITGLIMSRIMFNQYNDALASKTIEKAYFFEVGKFKKMEDFKDSSKYDSYIYVRKGDLYYVYIGITNSNYEKVQNYFDNLGYKTSVKELNVSSNFLSRLKEYDIRLKDTENNLDIKRILSDILKTYEEMSHSED